VSRRRYSPSIAWLWQCKFAKLRCRQAGGHYNAALHTRHRDKSLPSLPNCTNASIGRKRRLAALVVGAYCDAPTQPRCARRAARPGGSVSLSVETRHTGMAPHPRPFPHKGGREKSGGPAPLPSSQRGGRGWGMGGHTAASTHAISTEFDTLPWRSLTSSLAALLICWHCRGLSLLLSRLLSLFLCRFSVLGH